MYPDALLLTQEEPIQLAFVTSWIFVGELLTACVVAGPLLAHCS